MHFKKIIHKIYSYLRRVYRLSINLKKHEDLVWKDLKELQTKSNWNFGIFEKDRTIETRFEIAPDTGNTFYYMLYNNNFHCRVKIIEDFPLEQTTEVFILASHFNNLLTNGVVVVNVDSQYVEYHSKCNILIPLLFPDELDNQLVRHYNTSKDIFWAFQKLVLENEIPALIIADLLKKNDEEKKSKN